MRHQEQGTRTKEGDVVGKHFISVKFLSSSWTEMEKYYQILAFVAPFLDS